MASRKASEIVQQLEKDLEDNYLVIHCLDSGSGGSYKVIHRGDGPVVLRGLVTPVLLIGEEEYLLSDVLMIIIDSEDGVVWIRDAGGPDGQFFELRRYVSSK